MTSNWKVIWRVIVDGNDMTSAMRPYLIDIEITDKDGGTSDTCSLILDDTDGQIELPKDGASVEVFLNQVSKFKSTVDSGKRGRFGGVAILPGNCTRYRNLS